MLLAAVAAWVGGSYFEAYRQAVAPPSFYQNEFAPAVLSACGRGFMRPSVNAVPTLDAFVGNRRESFDCADLPANLELQSPGIFQRGFRYLMTTVSLYWRWTGVRWDNLAPIFAALYGLVAIAAYLSCRVVIGRVAASVTTLALVFSPAQLDMLPSLRDSTKSVFFVAAFGVLMFIAVRRPHRGKLLAACAGFGAILGVGLGFRPDVVLLLPALGLVLTAWLFPPTRWRVGASVAGLALAAALFLLAASPIIPAYQSGSNFSHVALLGFTRHFDEPLGLRSPSYTFAHTYNDAYMGAVISSFAQRALGVDKRVELTTPAYERYGIAYLREYAATFPADVAIRTWSAIRGILDLPFDDRLDAQVDRVAGLVPLVAQANGYRAKALHIFQSYGWAVTLAALGLLALTNAPAAISLGIVVLYLTALGALQYQTRHHFHLEFVPLVALGGLIDRAVSLARGAVGRRPDRTTRVAPSWRRIFVVGVSAALVIALPLASVAALRGRQQRTVSQLIAGYESRLAPASFMARPLSNGQVLLWPGEEEPPVSTAVVSTRSAAVLNVRTTYFAIDFNGSCPALVVDVGVRYVVNNTFTTFSRDILVFKWTRQPTDMARVYVPVYDSVIPLDSPEHGFRFGGFVVSDDERACVSGIQRVDRTSDLPILLEVKVEPGWDRRPLYQRAMNERLLAEEAAIPEYVSAGESRLTLSDLAAVGAPTPELRAVSRIAALDDGRLVVAGVGESRFTYLVLGAERQSPAGGAFLSSGELINGGLSVGLLRDGNWDTIANVETPGRFLVVLTPSKGGVFVPVIANNVAADGVSTRAVIDKLGWTKQSGSEEVAADNRTPALPTTGSKDNEGR